MNIKWADILRQLRSHPANVHRIRPPCVESRIATIEQQFGSMPAELSDLLRHFNGGRLFNKHSELVAIFGLSEEPPLPPLEWAPEWYIDKFTPKWRVAGPDRHDDWAIAMMNYGGLIVLNGQGAVREWDTSQQDWTPESSSFNQWIEKLMREGDAYLKEQ